MLCPSARAGVKVNVMINWAGSIKMEDTLLEQMETAGVVVNNPTACAIAEAWCKDAKVDRTQDLVVLSVGTGERNRPIDLKSAQEWGALEWAIPIIDVLFDGNTDSVDYIARHLVGDSYFRLQAELDIGLDDLDDTSSTNIAALEIMARDYLAQAATQKQLDRLMAML